MENPPPFGRKLLDGLVSQEGCKILRIRTLPRLPRPSTSTFAAFFLHPESIQFPPGTLQENRCKLHLHPRLCVALFMCRKQNKNSRLIRVQARIFFHCIGNDSQLPPSGSHSTRGCCCFRNRRLLPVVCSLGPAPESAAPLLVCRTRFVLNLLMNLHQCFSECSRSKKHHDFSSSM